MRELALSLAALLVASQAFAGSWDLNCDGSVTTGQIQLTPGQVACYDPSSNSDDSPLVALSDCENTDWFLFDDEDGDGTVCTVAWDVELCPSPKSHEYVSGSPSTSVPVAEKEIGVLTGTLPLGLRDAVTVGGVFCAAATTTVPVM